MTANGSAGVPFRRPPLQAVARVCLAGLLCTLSPATTPAQETAQTKPYELNVEAVATAPFVDDDEAQFQQRHRVPDEVSGGLRRFRYERDLGDGFRLKLLGRAIFNNHDYLVDADVRKEGVGWLRVGYKQFRTWYDGSGGWFPGNGAFFQVFDPELGLDRQEAWIQGGTTLPGDWELALRYRFTGRDGEKSSTVWGDTALTGLPSGTNRRAIVPAFWDIDEQRHIVEGDLTRRTDVTLLGAALRYEAGQIDNRRNVTRRPDEPGLERRFTQRDKSDDDVLTSRAFGEGRFWDDKVIVSAAYAYNDIDMDLAGSRIYGQTFNPTFDPLAMNRQPLDEGFFDLNGGTEMREHTGNAGVSVRAIEDLNITAAFRVRDETMNGQSAYTETNVGFGPKFLTTEDEIIGQSETNVRSFAESIEARYTGIGNVVLYARGDWEQNDGDIFERTAERETSQDILARTTNSERSTQDYAVGAKWYPLRRLNLSGEYSYRTRKYDYDHTLDNTPNDPDSGERYPAYLVSQDFATHDFNVRATLSLPGSVRLTGRYDYLSTTIDTQADLLAEIETGEMTSHILSGTMTWQPLPWMWLRSSLSYAQSQTDTPVDRIGGPASPIFPDFDNDYVTASVATGAALDAHTDAELLYHFYMADNDHDVSAYGQPYGADAQEHGIAVRVKRRFTDSTSVGLGYGYFNNDEGFAGGNYDYDAHVVTTSVEFTY